MLLMDLNVIISFGNFLIDILSSVFLMLQIYLFVQCSLMVKPLFNFKSGAPVVDDMITCMTSNIKFREVFF